MIRRTINRENKFRWFISLLISLLLAFLIGRDVILSSGYVLLAEQFEVYTIQNFIKYAYPTWNEQIQYLNFDGLPKIYLYGSLSLIARLMGNSYKALQILLLLLPYTIAFLSMQKLSEHVISKSLEINPTNMIFLSSLIAAFVYTINPWFANNPRNIIFRFQYAFLPLIILFFILILEENRNLKHIFLFAFTMAFIAGYRYLAITAPLFLLIFLVFNLLKENKVRAFIDDTKKLLLSAIIFLLLSVGKFLSPVLYSRSITPIAVEEFTTHKIQRENLLHIFSTKIYQWTASNFDLTYQDRSHFLFILVTAFAFIYLLFIGKRNKHREILPYLILFPSVFIFFGFLSAEEVNIDSFLLGLPVFSDFVGRLFRHARWNVMPMVLSISVMVGLSIAYSYEYLGVGRKFIVAFLSIAIILISSVSAWPMFTGDMNGYWTPSQIPEDYVKVNQIIGSEEEDFHVLWFPTFGGRRPVWGNATGVSEVTAPTGVFSIRSSSKPSYLTDNIYFFDLFDPTGIRPSFRALEGYTGENLEDIYLPLNVKYLIIHYDCNWKELERSQGFTNDVLKSSAEKLKEYEPFDVIYEGEYLTAFKLSNSGQKVFTKQPLIMAGGLETYGNLNLHDISIENYSVIFLDQTFNENLPVHQTSTFLTSDSDFLKSLILQKSSVRVGISPAKSAPVEVSPGDFWSYSTVDSYLFQKTLRDHDMEDWGWDFDYGKGLVFTMAPSIFEEPPELKEDDLLAKFDFEGGLDEWSIDTEDDAQKIFLSNTSHQGKHSLGFEQYNSSQELNTINSPLIPSRYGDQYRWEFHVKGEDAYSINAMIVEYDSTGNITTSKRIGAVGDGTFDWCNKSFIFVPASSDTRFIQLQIRHIVKTTNSTPNKIWIDDVKIYDLRSYLRPNSLDIPFEVKSDGSYELFIRYFQNKEGGEIGVYLDEELINMIDTKDQVNKFRWEKVNTLDMIAGEYTLTIENIEGFNAVNTFALFPHEEYENSKKEVYELIKDKRIVYIFEAESDLYGGNAGVFNTKGGEGNTGVVWLPIDTMLLKKIEIPKNDDYKIALKLNGSVLVTIDNQSFEVNSTSSDFLYVGPFHLSKGEHMINITPNLINPNIWGFTGFEEEFGKEFGELSRLHLMALELYNFDFEEHLDEWNGTECPEHELSVDVGYGGDCIKAELYNSTRGWKAINSPLVPVSYGNEYVWKFRIKGENAHMVRMRISEYNSNKEYIGKKYHGEIGDGTFDWENITLGHMPSQNASYIQLQVLHGRYTTKPIPNIIWIDDVKTYRYSPPSLDVLWLYSTESENESLEDIFSPEDTPAEVISYEKINPTRYIVKVKAEDPFMLSFAESYDPLWAAYVGDREYEPIPLYSVINGFLIDETGDVDVTIEYKPQRWFYYGAGVSILSLVGCIGYLIYDWRKKN